jgi:hypothetical protein
LSLLPQPGDFPAGIISLCFHQVSFLLGIIDFEISEFLLHL